MVIFYIENMVNYYIDYEYLLELISNEYNSIYVLFVYIIIIYGKVSIFYTFNGLDIVLMFIIIRCILR